MACGPEVTGRQKIDSLMSAHMRMSLFLKKNLAVIHPGAPEHKISRTISPD
jgi:hypothetical protein